MNCPKCGAEILATDMFCVNCGTNLMVNNQAPAPQPVEPQYQPPVQPVQPAQPVQPVQTVQQPYQPPTSTQAPAPQPVAPQYQPPAPTRVPPQQYGVNPTAYVPNPSAQGAMVPPAPAPAQNANNKKTAAIIAAVVSILISLSLVAGGGIFFARTNVKPSATLREAFDLSEGDDNNYHVINTYKGIEFADCDIDSDNQLYYYNQLDEEGKQMYEAFDYSVENFDAFCFDMPDEALDEDGYLTIEYENKLAEVEKYYECDHPLYFWSYSCETYYMLGNYYYCDFHYTFSDKDYGYTNDELDAFISDREEFNSRLNSMITAVDEKSRNADEWNTAFNVFDYICDNISYDMELSEKIMDDEYFDNATTKQYDEILLGGGIYSAVMDGTTVCRGYAMLYKAIANQLDIECAYVPGFSNFYQSVDENADDDDSGHAWNIIKIGNGYTNVDVTNGDMEDKNEPKSVYYFCMDDSLIKGSYVKDDDIHLPACNSPELNFCQHEGLYSTKVAVSDLDKAIRYALEHKYNTAIIQYSSVDLIEEADEKYTIDSDVLGELLVEYDKTYDSQINVDDLNEFYVIYENDFRIYKIILNYSK